MLEVYKAHLAQIEDTVRKQNIITLPKRDAVIRLVHGSRSGRAARAAHRSAAPHRQHRRACGIRAAAEELRGRPDGRLRLTTPSRWTITAHECRPGHELQFAGMLERGVSNARAVYAFNSANVEGWALYAEAVMKQYLPLEGQLGALQMRLMRAARAFLDPMLNLGLIEPGCLVIPGG